MSVAFRSAAFRPLVTAGAAGIMLCGLFFIPSAHGEGPHGVAPRGHARTVDSVDAANSTGSADSADRSAAFSGQSPRASRQLAFGGVTGSAATPYVAGCAGALCAGAAFVTRAAHRRDEA